VVFNVVQNLVGIDAVVLIICRLPIHTTKIGVSGRFDPLNGKRQQWDPKKHILA